MPYSHLRALTRSGKPVGALVAALGAVLAASAPLGAARSDYVGAGACKDCHAEEYALWKGSAHAGAASPIGDTRPACDGCHRTGEAPAGRAYFDGVQCEACHGAGAGYAADDLMRDPVLAAELGLRDLSTPTLRAALCAECHRAATTLAPFDAGEAWKAIAH